MFEAISCCVVGAMVPALPDSVLGIESGAVASSVGRCRPPQMAGAVKAIVVLIVFLLLLDNLS